MTSLTVILQQHHFINQLPIVMMRYNDSGSLKKGEVFLFLFFLFPFFLVLFMVPDRESLIVEEVWQQENGARSQKKTSSTTIRKQRELEVRQHSSSPAQACDAFRPARLYLPKFPCQAESLTGK